jgi:hypothetical protein
MTMLNTRIPEFAFLNSSSTSEIKKTGWRGVTRSAFIRALIRATMQRNVDVGGATGEAELEQRLSLE